MTLRRICLALVAVAVLAVPAYAAAAKMPANYQYGTKCTKIGCSIAAYTNSKSTRIIAFSIGPKCSTKGSSYSASLSAVIKINSKGKFNSTLAANSFDTGDAQGTAGVVTVKGKVTAKDKIKGTWSTDKVSAGCANAKTGKVTLKYKGVVTGG